jgi:hypothetical protein
LAAMAVAGVSAVRELSAGTSRLKPVVAFPASGGSSTGHKLN